MYRTEEKTTKICMNTSAVRRESAAQNLTSQLILAFALSS